jgi:TRAP-type C4-dicarboxylate transport system substrate-binding protein
LSRAKPLWQGVRQRARAALLTGLVLAGPVAWAEPARFAATRLRIVGGMASTSQYQHYEEPFWTRTLPALTGQQVQAEIEPFDRAGIRGQDVLRLMQTGVVPFGTAVFGLSAANEPLIGAPALAGINPDMATLRRTVTAFRPVLQRHLREHNGVELLAIYAYPAQVIFCNKAFSGLGDLARRRVRVSGAAQADLIEARGGQPVYTAFADIVPQMRGGALDCAITGAMAGNANGLFELTTHVHAMAINWGLSLFAANQAAWSGLRPELRQLLQQQLPKLEQAIWAAAELESVEGLACNAGAATCRNGRKGQMTVVNPSPADVQRLKQVLVQTVLPRWAARCGPQCVGVWNSTLAPSVGVTLGN